MHKQKKRKRRKRVEREKNEKEREQNQDRRSFVRGPGRAEGEKEWVRKGENRKSDMDKSKKRNSQV